LKAMCSYSHSAGTSAYSNAGDNLIQHLNGALGPWNESNTFEAYVDSRLGSFNATFPKEAVKLYSEDSDQKNGYESLARMITDVNTNCPMQVKEQEQGIGDQQLTFPF